jgi:Protein  of unknown function (DUF3018)
MSQPEKPPRSDEERRAARRERERRRRRADMRAKELRPVTLWVWDTRSPEFREEARRQMQRIAADAAEHEFAAMWSREADTTDGQPSRVARLALPQASP